MGNHDEIAHASSNLSLSHVSILQVPIAWLSNCVSQGVLQWELLNGIVVLLCEPVIIVEHLSVTTILHEPPIGRPNCRFFQRAER
jgi:hypothetical protein